VSYHHERCNSAVRRFDSLEVSTRALVKQAIIGGAVPGSCLFAAAPLSPAALCAMLGDLRFGVTPATRFVLSSMKRGTWVLPWGPKESWLRIARAQHAFESSGPGRGAQVAHLAFLACDISFIGAWRRSGPARPCSDPTSGTPEAGSAGVRRETRPSLPLMRFVRNMGPNYARADAGVVRWIRAAQARAGERAKPVRRVVRAKQD
jgi:hypothetical protein